MKKARSSKRPAPAKPTTSSGSKRTLQQGESSARRAGALSERPAPKDFDDYLATIPEQARQPLMMIREAILSVVPAEAAEVISYGIPAFKHKKVLVWYGGFSRHCSLFPTAAILDAYKDELKGYTRSKGTVQFPLNRPMPIALIKKLVKARVAKEK